MTTIQAAGIVIFTKTQPAQFLLMKHRKRWDLPKGHAEPGEGILETALRETDEETGIRPAQIEIDPDFRYEVSYEVDGKKRGRYWKELTYFLGFIESKCELLVTEHVGYEWLTWPVPPIQQQTIDPLLSAVGKHLSKRKENS